jgi:hypothetical protein
LWKDRSIYAFALETKFARFTCDMRHVVHVRHEPGTAVHGRSLSDLIERLFNGSANSRRRPETAP